MKQILFVFFLLLGAANLGAQIPVEIFVGHERSTFDVLFFRYLKNHDGQNSRWLFFNRNRASIDYRITSTQFLPQYGFTEALSYNIPTWKGIAPVLVAQLLNRGIYPKTGLQYARVSKTLTVFGWVVTETRQKPNLDLFILARYTPSISEKIQLFSQIELVNAFPTVSLGSYSFIQRARLGLKMKDWQYGLGADLTRTGHENWVTTQNIGVFLRHEF